MCLNWYAVKSYAFLCKYDDIYDIVNEKYPHISIMNVSLENLDIIDVIKYIQYHKKYNLLDTVERDGGIKSFLYATYQNCNKNMDIICKLKSRHFELKYIRYLKMTNVSPDNLFLMIPRIIECIQSSDLNLAEMLLMIKFT